MDLEQIDAQSIRLMLDLDIADTQALTGDDDMGAHEVAETHRSVPKTFPRLHRKEPTGKNTTSATTIADRDDEDDASFEFLRCPWEDPMSYTSTPDTELPIREPSAAEQTPINKTEESSREGWEVMGNSPAARMVLRPSNRKQPSKLKSSPKEKAKAREPQQTRERGRKCTSYHGMLPPSHPLLCPCGHDHCGECPSRLFAAATANESL
ncbi:hypothetical protein GMORB2_0518 [Geosmithia morbida]|uniref:Uncharacterized protein n=1 Tax=Geosmithia morbida TaxID=1094350 RepID=A0A9P5D7M5_9HYPO|nr:uncharacterized protein GMORB2_0518 [Geosmithia morbida]KAF4126781.1 hypothetical protein GMORB2_0518 [Geosmithia morbida]